VIFRRPAPNFPSAGFALISVLALVSLAALTATAFLSAARLDRRANMSISDATRIEMALHAGSIAAQEMLDYAPSKQYQWVTTYWRGTSTNDWTNELGYLLNGAGLYGNSTSTICNFYACFSTATMTNLSNTASALLVLSNAATNQGMFLTNLSGFMSQMTNGFTLNPSPTSLICTTIPLLGNCTSPPVGWVYIRQDVRVKPGLTNTTNIPVVRFAFYVQDLSGMIDAERMGGAASRDTGTNPAEISLTNATGTSLTNSTVMSNLISSSNRWNYFSPGMLALSNVGNLTNSNDLRYVTAGRLAWTNSWNRIPSCLGYADSGKHKTPLGRLNFTNSGPPTPSTDPTVNTNTNFCFFLTSNLRQFPARSGGMDSNRYVQALAVNFKDYVDTDINPTTNGSGANVVRGIEPLPFLTESATEVWWYDHGTNIPGFAGNIADEFHMANYIELWNPGDRPFSGNLTVSFSNNLGCDTVNSIPLNIGSITNSAAARSWSNSLGTTHPHTNVINVTPALEPNEYRVFFLGTNIYRFRIATGTTEGPWYNGSTATNGKLNIGNPGSPTADSYGSKVSLAYSGTVYDQATNCHRATHTLYCRRFASGNNALPDWFGSVPSLRKSPTDSPPLPGDPRIGFYLNCIFFSQGYASTAANRGNSMGYRNLGKSSGGVNYETAPTRWLDGGYTNSPLAPVPITEASFPNLSRQTTNFSNEYVQKFNNTGNWSNTVEMGNIFDPMAWNVDATGSNPQITTNTSAATGLTNGGGTTLRIGRLEHARFSWTNDPTPGALPAPNMMMSSAALLDLFCVEGKDQQIDEGNQINLNTAPAPVLRALAGSIVLTNDRAQVPANQAVPAGMAEAFAQGVMRFRAKYPFYSPSQLVFIGTDPAWPNTTTWPANAVFGNTNSIFLVTNSVNSQTNTALGVSAWGDQAAEEWFSKIYRLSTTQSRSFRCYVVAQLVNEKGEPRGPMAKKYYHIFSRISTDSYTNNVADISSSTYNIYECRY